MKKAIFLFAMTALGWAQTASSDPKQRVKDVREIAKQGQDAIPRLTPYVKDPDINVRLEAVKALVAMGGPRVVDPLLTAARDNDPEVQIRATDGLVDVYLPGYVKTGMSGSLQRAGNSIKGKFSDSTNDQVIEEYVMVRPEVIAALGKLVTGGASLEVRANAARALGILRGKDALPDLIEALHSKQDMVMYEALVAIQKIRDPEAAPRISFLLRDLDDKIQMTALETTGILRNRDAAPDVRDALEHARNIKIKRSAMTALAMLGDPEDHALFVRSLTDKDDAIRGAAAEGLARLDIPADRPVVEKAFNDEHKMSPRLSDAFAEVSLGNLDTSEFSALRYLINTLNVRSFRDVASPFLTELARNIKVRQAIYPMLPRATRDEKIQLSIVLARAGDRDSLPYLETLSTDADSEVAAEGVRSLRTLRARLP
ncbi:MAG TPA: HEAT repeat domain-containing protein [Bryobacteraceae bacterium]|nr:HEAT repeat domain-containing protein [Bryobacteraceae bacterium]